MLIFAHASGAHNNAHAVGDIQAVDGFTDFRALITFNATGNTAGTRVVGHQHQVAASQTNKGGQGCALIAALFLFNLHNDFGAFGNRFLDTDASAIGFFAEVFGRNFLQWQKAVALGAKVDKCRLKTGFNAGDAAFEDTGLFLHTCSVFNVQVIEFLAIDKGDP